MRPEYRGVRKEEGEGKGTVGRTVIDWAKQDACGRGSASVLGFAVVLAFPVMRRVKVCIVKLTPVILLQNRFYLYLITLSKLIKIWLSQFKKLS